MIEWDVVSTKRSSTGAHLAGELTCGRHDERLWGAATLRRVGVGDEALTDGKDEGEGFASASAGATEDVKASAEALRNFRLQREEGGDATAAEIGDGGVAESAEAICILGERRLRH